MKGCQLALTLQPAVLAHSRSDLGERRKGEMRSGHRSGEGTLS